MRNLLMGLVSVVAFWLTAYSGGGPTRIAQLGLASVAVAGASCSPRWPLGAVIASGAATTVAWFMGLTFDPFSMTGIALFELAGRSDAHRFPRPLVIGVLTIFGMLFMLSTEGIGQRLRGVLLSAGVLVASWVMGVTARQIRVEVAHRSRAAERLRLSRDMHDVLSHTLGTIGIQAGVAAHVASLSDEELRGVLRDIEGRARTAVDELKGLLAYERVTTGADDGSVLKGSLLSALSVLVNDATRAGVRVSLAVPAEGLEHLPKIVGTTIYRLSQEALTNVVRHSGSTSALLAVEFAGSAVRLRISDDGRGGARDIREGYGMRGMRERVALLGGRMTVNDGDSGGLVVRVELPVTGGRGNG